MAIKTYTEQLEEVQAAISKILSGGQSYSVMGRSMTYADLPTLYAAEDRLRRKIAEESNGGIITQFGVIR